MVVLMGVPLGRVSASFCQPKAASPNQSEHYNNFLGVSTQLICKRKNKVLSPSEFIPLTKLSKDKKAPFFPLSLGVLDPSDPTCTHSTAVRRNVVVFSRPRRPWVWYGPLAPLLAAVAQAPVTPSAAMARRATRLPSDALQARGGGGDRTPGWFIRR